MKLYQIKLVKCDENDNNQRRNELRPFYIRQFAIILRGYKQILLNSKILVTAMTFLPHGRLWFVITSSNLLITERDLFPIVTALLSVNSHYYKRVTVLIYPKFMYLV